MLNLLTDSWLPVLRRDSGPYTIRLSQITEHHAENPIIAIDWPRPDLRIATLELLTGALATFCPPEDGDEWLRKWHDPPPPEQLTEAFAPFAHAFELDGNGPRFLQDMEDLDSGAEPVERLLIEAPGGSTVTKNTDLLVHRDGVASLGRPAAAIVLYTFQSWAPAGGAGNRTGLRGGGPLVTLIVPGDAPTLWQLLWANVPARENALKSRDFPHVFPWLAPAAGSKSGHVVTPENAHGLQCWWGMPRRIRLDFTALETPRACGLTGEPDSVQVATWRQRPHGANYTDWGRIHPLTPHYQPKNSQEWLPVHPQPGGIGYRDWLGLVLKSEDGSRIPAAVVPEWRDVRGRDAGDPRARILAAGFDMDNMKARSFIESELPLPAAPTEAARDAMDDLAKSLVESANQVASLARNAVRDALFDRGATVKADALPFNTVRERLWEQTESSFFTALEKVARQPDTMGKTREEWLKMLRPLAFSLFDEAAPLAPDTDQKNAARIAQARKFLGFALHGYGKAGNDLFGKLNLNLPETKQVKPKGRGT